MAEADETDPAGSTAGRQPVERCGPGLWRIDVPILIGPSRRTLVYLIECDRGFALIDAGWDWDEGATALFDGIRATGHDPVDCVGVLVTHGHPDHHGLSGRMRDASDAWIGLHPIEAEQVALGLANDLDLTLTLLDAAGVPSDVLPDMPRSLGDALPIGAAPDRHLNDDDVIDLGGRRVRVLWTPGHSPGHLAFLLEDERVLATGDNVLTHSPTPIAHWGGGQDDPLGDLLRSLRRLRDLPVDLVLPGHEMPFNGLADRIDALLEHFDDWLAIVTDALAGGPRTMWDVSMRVDDRPTTSLRGMIHRVMGIGAVSAALQYLQVHGRLRVDHSRDDAARYTLIEG
jgi:glyoxylase-like metal-dependent hydrolase (beta-lactamase superfamily II)